MSLKNWKECFDTDNPIKEKELKGKLIIKEAELEAKDMLITDLLYLLIDNKVNLIKAGYQDLVEEFGVDFDDKR